MKKILALLLVLVMALSVIACGKTEAPQEDTQKETIETPAGSETEESDEEEAKKPEESAKPSEKPAEKPVESEKPSSAPSEKPAETAATVGSKLVAEFNSKAKSGTPLSIAESIANGGSLPFMAGAMEVEPGLLSGFDNYEVTGFKTGAVFMPMIGSIPFIGYVFELDDGVSAAEFTANLKKNANKRWNICVEAEEMVTSTVGNKVFFLMCPKQFEE